MFGWIAAHFDFIATALTMAAALTLAVRASSAGNARAAGGTSIRLQAAYAVVTVAAFVLPVIAYWLSGRSHPNALAGLLPYNDAAVYFTCAVQILNHVTIDGGCRMRPFYSGMFAGIFEFGGRNLQIALLLQAAIIGAGAWLLLREVARGMSTAATFAVFAVLFLFAAQFCAAIVLTENAGLLLGLLGIAVLWRSGERVSAGGVFLALLLLTAGQNARAGAILILPALLAWVALSANRAGKERLRLAASGLAGIAAGFLVTLALAWTYGGIGGNYQSNFSYILYEMAAGGKTYLQVNIDHPEIFAASGTDAEIASRIYHVAFVKLLHAPQLFVFGYFKGLLHYLDHLFKFVRPLPVRLVFIVLWVLGLYAAIKNRSQPRAAMLLWIAAAVLVSSPFLTFNGGTRIYAVTFPADAILVGLGIGVVERRRGLGIDGMQPPPLSQGLAAAGVLALLLAFTGPLAGSFSKPPARVASQACAPDRDPVVVRPGRETLVLPLVERGKERMFPLRVVAEDFDSRFDRWVFDPDSLRQPAGSVFIWGFQLDAAEYGQMKIFIWPGGSDIPLNKPVQFCVERPAADRPLRIPSARTMTVLPEGGS